MPAAVRLSLAPALLSSERAMIRSWAIPPSAPHHFSYQRAVSVQASSLARAGTQSQCQARRWLEVHVLAGLPGAGRRRSPALLASHITGPLRVI